MRDRIEWIYAEIPRLNCRRLCQRACGPILATPAEIRYFEQNAGLAFPSAFQLVDTGALSCPILGIDGSCLAYRFRPLICRLWGVVDVDGMRCPHGCQPSRWLTDGEAKALLRRAQDLD